MARQGLLGKTTLLVRAAAISGCSERLANPSILPAPRGLLARREDVGEETALVL